MGHDATSYLPPRTAPTKVESLLIDLGYKRVPVASDDEDGILAFFNFWEDTDYRSHSVIEATLSRGERGDLTVATHTTIWRSPADAEKHNETLRELKRHFGGHFLSDRGRNRYLPETGHRRAPAESGCYLAYTRLRHNIARAELYLRHRSFPEHLVKPRIAFVQDLSPLTLSNNMLRTFLVGALEDYLKSTFVALLRHSERKEAVFRSARLTSDDLLEISYGRTSVEQAYANSFSFQNIGGALKKFQELEPKLQIHAALVKPYRRRKVKLLDSLMRIVHRRNRFIHENELDFSCDESRIGAELHDVTASVDRVYSALTKHYNWFDERPI